LGFRLQSILRKLLFGHLSIARRHLKLPKLLATVISYRLRNFLNQLH